MKKPVKVEHLANWYFGAFCTKCGRIDNEEDNHAKDCHDNIHLIVDNLKQSGTEKMTHKDFVYIIKTSHSVNLQKENFMNVLFVKN